MNINRRLEKLETAKCRVNDIYDVSDEEAENFLLQLYPGLKREDLTIDFLEKLADGIVDRKLLLEGAGIKDLT